MSVQSLCKTAIDFHRRGQMAEAERLCLQALGLEPSDFTALYLMGAIRLQQGRHGEAADLFGKAAAGAPGAPEPHFMRGLALQALHRPQEALAGFEAALARRPDYLEALFNKAVLLGGLGRIEAALEAYGRILALQPRHAAALYNRGVLLGDLKRHDEALASLDQAVAIQPAFPEAWNNRGFVLQALRRPEEALASFDKALALAPDYDHAWTNRGVALRELGRLEEALDSFGRAIALAPEGAEAWNGQGFVQQRLGRLDAALDSFDKALAIEPAYAEALFNRSSVLCEMGRVVEGFDSFARHAQLAEGQAPPTGDGSPPAHKMRHDEEQRAYLDGLARGGGDPAPGTRTAGPAVNPAAATAEISERWKSGAPQMVVIDDFLTDEALDRLRRFCWGAQVWKTVYENGYLGAMLEAGLASPLLAQIVEELRQAYPDILGEHTLQYLWAFKYDSRLKGINVHADRAAVNVNFWITPDEANLEPDSGGLAVWDVAAPLHWDYETYNADPEAIRRFLAQSGAGKVTVPHRANRAVIFDSDLFHETDRIAFKDGYLNRRINVTMLFGRRSTDHR